MDVDRLRSEVSTCLASGDFAGAWALVAPSLEAVDRDPALADLWLQLLAQTPERPTLVSEARRILARWPEDPDRVIAANRALIAAAERRPLDEPLLREDGPAALAAEAAARCLAALPDGTPAAQRARLWNTRGNALRLAGPAEDAAAREAFAKAVELDPEDGR